MVILDRAVSAWLGGVCDRDHHRLDRDHHADTLWAMRQLFMPLRHQPVVEQIGLARHVRSGPLRYPPGRLWAAHFYHYEGVFILDGQPIKVSPGDLSLAPPGSSHSWEPPQDALHHYCLFRFPPASAADGLHLAMRHHLPPIQANPLIIAWDQATARSLTEPSAGAAFLWNLLWSLAPGPAAARAAGVPGISSPSPPTLIADVLRLLEEDLAGAWTLDRMSHHVGRSPNQIIRLFQAHTGHTPLVWLRRRRAALARDLLGRSALPADVVARRIGLPDAPALRRFLRRMADSV